MYLPRRRRRLDIGTGHSDIGPAGAPAESQGQVFTSYAGDDHDDDDHDDDDD